MIRTIVAAFAAASCSMSAWAGPSESNSLLFHHRANADIWQVDFNALRARIPAVRLIPESVAADSQPAPVHAAAIQHSDAYLMRAKIPRYASYASLPLFAAEVYLGE